MTESRNNPSSIGDALTDKFYAQKGTKKARLKKERNQQIDWLRKKYPDDRRAQEISDKLESCRTRIRCRSLACPECAYALRRLVVKTMRSYLSGKNDVVCVTVVPNEPIKPGKLNSADHQRYVRRVKDKLARAHGGFVIAAVDWSMNEHLQGDYKPFWCPHLHGVAVTNDVTTMRKALKTVFPKTDRVFKRVTVTEWDGEARWLRYCFGSEFKRRISTDNGKRHNKTTGEKRQCRDTDQQPLKSKHKLELLKLLDDIGIAGRLVLRGVQFQNLKDTGPTLIDRQMKSAARKKAATVVLEKQTNDAWD